MTTVSNSSSYRPLHPFDSVYTIVFIFLMYYILGSKIGEICYLYLNDDSLDIWLKLEKMFYQFVVAIFFFYQLSRMYYYLKNFEEIIGKKGNNHFLEILSNGFQSSEKIVRLILASIIILFSKYQSQMYFLSLTLILCFILLIIWDFIVIAGLKDNKINQQSESFVTAKTFFYIEDNTLRSNRFYFGRPKFFERLCGLIASTVAFFYQIQGKSNSGTFLFFLFILALIGFSFFAYYGKYRIDELKKDNYGEELSDDISRPFYLPIYKLIYNLNLIK